MSTITPVFPKVNFTAPSASNDGIVRLRLTGDDYSNWTGMSVVVGKATTAPTTYGDLTSPRHDTLVSEGDIQVRGGVVTVNASLPSTAFSVGDHLWAALDPHETPSSGDTLSAVTDLGVVVA